MQNNNYTRLPERVYREIINLYNKMLNNYYNELSTKYTECSNVRTCNEFTNYFDESFNKTLKELFNQVNNSLINSSILLNASDYESVYNELNNVTETLEQGINWNRIRLMYQYLTTIEWYTPTVINVINDVEDFVSNATSGTLSNYEELTPEARVIFWIIIILISVFPPITWLACLIRGGKTHGRLYWLTIIFLLNFIGAAYYWIKEH